WAGGGGGGRGGGGGGCPPAAPGRRSRGPRPGAPGAPANRTLNGPPRGGGGPRRLRQLTGPGPPVWQGAPRLTPAAGTTGHPAPTRDFPGLVRATFEQDPSGWRRALQFSQLTPGTAHRCGRLARGPTSWCATPCPPAGPPLTWPAP